MRKDAPGAPAGFTLVELMTTLAVAAILAGLAVPGMQRFLEWQRATGAMHALTTQLALARNAAVSARTPVTLCPTRGGGRCAESTDWSTGWLLYRDPARLPQPRVPDDVLRDEHAPVHGSIRVFSTQGRARVRYQPDGLAPGTNVTFRICSGERLHAEVVVNNSGRTRWTQAPADTPCGPPG